MKAVRQCDTASELAVRRILSRLGTGYRCNVRKLPGSPDIANRRRKKAIFVNGCFWHGHVPCGRWTVPKTNPAKWVKKIRANRVRDQRKIDQLRELGFDVLVVWECELDHAVALEKRLKRFWFPEEEGGETEAEEEGGLTHAETGHVEGASPPETYEFDVDRWRLRRRVNLRPGGSSVTEIEPVEPVADVDLSAAFDLAWLDSATRPEYETVGTAEPVRIADLFCGCGGMSLGVLEAARALGRRAQVVLAADLDQEALDVFRENLRPRVLENRDLAEVLNGSIGAPPMASEADLVERVGDVDVLVGGPPCQGHSNLNNHTRRADPKNELYERMARFAELFAPSHVIIENVTGVLHDRAGVFERTRRALEKLGYPYVSPGMLHGEVIGVPQTRHRVFMIASKDHPVSPDSVERKYGVSERDFDWACRHVWLNRRNGPMSSATKLKPITKGRIDHLHDQDEDILPNHLRPDCHRLKDHSYVSVYGRLRGDRPAPTITTGFTVMGQGRFVHPYERRTLTPMEGARLQFFPDWFDFGDRSRKDYVRLIGNAVPPKMAYVLALEMLR